MQRIELCALFRSQHCLELRTRLQAQQFLAGDGLAQRLRRGGRGGPVKCWRRRQRAQRLIGLALGDIERAASGCFAVQNVKIRSFCASLKPRSRRNGGVPNGPGSPSGSCIWPNGGPPCIGPCGSGIGWARTAGAASRQMENAIAARRPLS
jgi:hypothetical protein